MRSSRPCGGRGVRRHAGWRMRSAVAPRGARGGPAVLRPRCPRRPQRLRTARRCPPVCGALPPRAVRSPRRPQPSRPPPRPARAPRRGLTLRSPPRAAPPALWRCGRLCEVPARGDPRPPSPAVGGGPQAVLAAEQPREQRGEPGRAAGGGNGAERSPQRSRFARLRGSHCAVGPRL